MTQWAVVWRPDPTHVVRVLGPYRSAEKANKVEAELEALEDECDIVTGFDDESMSLLPQVVPFEDWRDVERELRAKYQPTEPPCGDHKPVQHRDGKPPWCKRCGLTASFTEPVSPLSAHSSEPSEE